MNTSFYLKEFESACSKINKQQLAHHNLQLFTGVVLNSVVVKVYKPQWSNDPPNAVTASSRVFFSVWINEDTIKESRLYYNIHAFKLRQISGYKIASRLFAERFRDQFKRYSKDWPNIDTKYGPLTLMQGWKSLDHESLQADITELVQQFYKIAPLIDTTFNYFL